MTVQHTINITVNGKVFTLEVSANETLADVLREKLSLTGTKIGCDSGTCGSCSVLIDGKLRNSCLTLAPLLDGATITTIEGLCTGETLHPVQKAFLDNGAIQCGFCTPGMVMAAVSLLHENHNPTREDIREAISGNICRCTGYTKILKAIEEAARITKER